jgi:hypothetical protein
MTETQPLYAFYSQQAVDEGLTSVSIYESLDRPGEEVSVTNVFSSEELLIKHKTDRDVNVGRVGKWIRNEQGLKTREEKHHYWGGISDEDVVRQWLETWGYDRHHLLLRASVISTKNTINNNE